MTDTTGNPTVTPVTALGPGQSATSPNTIATYQGPVQKAPVSTLVMQTDGNLVLYLLNQSGGQGPALWNSHTSGHPGAHAVSQSDGNFVVYDTAGHALWASGTWGQSGTAVLLSTGGLRAGDPANRTVWYSTGIEQVSQWCPSSTPPGMWTDLTNIGTGAFLQATNAWLLLQDDGNLVIYRKRDNAPLWNSGTSGSDANHLTLQDDGNLVLANPPGTPRWAAGTYNHAGDRAVFQADGNLVVYDKNGTALWSSGTWQTTNQ